MTPLLIQRRAEAGLRARNEGLREGAGRLTRLAAENERLSNAVARAKGSPSLTEAQLLELLRLRNEVRQLRWTIKAMDQFRSELRRTRDGLERLAKEKARGVPKAAALATDEIELDIRRGRVAQMREYLKENPEQEVPEMKLVSEDQWQRGFLWTPVTDADFQGLASGMRNSGAIQFASMTRDALRQYVQANEGRFPSDLLQLKPYMPPSVDDAILQRWHIVPANSLIPPLARAGGDWVITQVAPVNRRDTRWAIGVNRITMANSPQNPWDPAP